MSDYRLRRVKSFGSVLSHLKPLREHFGDWRAVGINFRAIEAYITTRREDEKSNATINRERFSELVREETARFDGRIVDRVGDAFLLVFPDTRAAVRCALEIDDASEHAPRADEPEKR